MPNISVELKISNSYLGASQMVVDFLENVNKNHENLKHMAAIVKLLKKRIYRHYWPIFVKFERIDKNTGILGSISVLECQCVTANLSGKYFCRILSKSEDYWYLKLSAICHVDMEQVFRRPNIRPR